MTAADALHALERLAPHVAPDATATFTECLTTLRAATQTPAGAEAVALAQAEALVHSALLVSELEAAREELKLVAHEAETANRAKSAFLANMSHELRTPLNAVIGYAELAMEQAADEALDWVVGDLQRIRDSGRHLLALVNNVLDISKIEAGRVELEIAPFALEDLIRTLQQDFTMLARNKGIGFLTRVIGDAGEMTTDYTRVRQVMNNVIANACKFTLTGSVTVTIDAAADAATFTVRDTGIGMSAEQLTYLFKRFHQADTSTTRRFGGSGLGLHLCRELCILLGGTIAVDSELDVGTTVVVRFPRAAPASGPAKAQAALASPTA